MNQNNTIEIKSNEIIQLILQYLQQNKLTKSFMTLQQQSGVSLNQITNTKQFIQAFKNKNWTKIIPELTQLMLSQDLFFTIYEFIVDSLIENDQYQAAEYIINEIIRPNIKEMALYAEKLMRMEYIINHPSQKNLYKNPPNELRQSNLLNKIFTATTQTQSSRLIKLLTQSIKYQVNEGIINPSIKLNLFSGRQQQQLIQDETIIKQIQKTISYSEQSKITEIKMSWSQEYLAIGGVDGLIQLYNTKDYTLYDNEYQREGQMFFHDHPISILEFNYSDEMLASVDSTGLINIWNLKNGKLLRKIDKESNINAICWGIDPSHLLVGYKERIKVYGIRSCNVLKQYSSNSSQYIHSLFVTQSRLFSISTNGSLIIFNYFTQQQLFTLQTKSHISSIFRLFKNTSTHQFNRFLIAFKKKISEIDEYGTEVKNYSVEDGEIENAIAIGEYIYVCVKGQDDKFRLSVIERLKKKVVFYMGLQAGFEHMIMSRKRNLLITYDQKHQLAFWRPI